MYKAAAAALRLWDLLMDWEAVQDGDRKDWFKPSMLAILAAGGGLIFEFAGQTLVAGVFGGVSFYFSLIALGWHREYAERNLSVTAGASQEAARLVAASAVVFFLSSLGMKFFVEGVLAGELRPDADLRTSRIALGLFMSIGAASARTWWAYYPSHLFFYSRLTEVERQSVDRWTDASLLSAVLAGVALGEVLSPAALVIAALVTIRNAKKKGRHAIRLAAAEADSFKRTTHESLLSLEKTPERSTCVRTAILCGAFFLLNLAFVHFSGPPGILLTGGLAGATLGILWLVRKRPHVALVLGLGTVSLAAPLIANQFSFELPYVSFARGSLSSSLTNGAARTFAERFGFLLNAFVLMILVAIVDDADAPLKGFMKSRLAWRAFTTLKILAGYGLLAICLGVIAVTLKTANDSGISPEAIFQATVLLVFPLTILFYGQKLGSHGSTMKDGIAEIDLSREPGGLQKIVRKRTTPTYYLIGGTVAALGVVIALAGVVGLHQWVFTVGGIELAAAGIIFAHAGQVARRVADVHPDLLYKLYPGDERRIFGAGYAEQWNLSHDYPVLRQQLTLELIAGMVVLFALLTISVSGAVSHVECVQNEVMNWTVQQYETVETCRDVVGI